MKRCPECRRDYYDDTLLYCLEDGTELVQGSVPSHDEPPTAILPDAQAIVTSNPYPSGETRTEVFRDPSASQTENAKSIAVLPFVNMSADVENEYFCDGLAEELLNALAKIDDIKVAARTSAFSFKGKNANVGEIGRMLSVNTVLEGSVRRAGDRVRITIQLINASDGYHIWSERYDREMQDIFALQDEITLAVVDALRLKLLGAEKQAVLRRHTNDPEAYQHYLRGRFFFFKRTPEGFMKAIKNFEKAIELDPEYAVACSGLVDSYVFLGFYELIEPKEAEEKYRPYLKRALATDDTIVETNTSVALVRSMYDWDFRGSLEGFNRGVLADPNYPFAYHLKSSIVLLLGKIDEAYDLEKRAIMLDPFTPIFNATLGWWYYLGRLTDEAIAQSMRTIEIAPNHFFAHWVLGLAYGEQGSYADAVVAFQNALALNQFDQHIRADLGRIFGMMGEREEAEKILAEFKERSKEKYVSAVSVAKVYAGLGDREKVIEWLEKAFVERSVQLPWFIIDPALDDYRDDPRIAEIRRKMNLPE